MKKLTTFERGYFTGLAVMGIITAILFFLLSCEPIDQVPGIITDNDTIFIIIQGK